MASAINWAWKIQGLRPVVKFLLIAMADDADPRTGTCWMHSNTARFAEDLGVGRRYIQLLEKELIDEDLIHTTERNPGSGDGQRLFHVHIDVDPATWTPKKARSRRVIMSTCDFQAFLRLEFQTAVEVSHYELYLSTLQLVNIERSRLVCRVPSEEIHQAITSAHLPTILKVAKVRISPKLHRVRLLYPAKIKPKKTQ